MSTETGTTLQLTRVMAASPETVFRAWTDPGQLERWSCPEGGTVMGAEVDLTVGGRYRIRMRMGEAEYHTARGVYREIERPRRLVYTWSWEEEAHGPAETLVTVEFNDLGGSTEVVLTHELFPNGEAKSNHEAGWASCLSRLERLFA